jgi:hypothetical protein
MAAMRYRKLRIAWSVLCSIICLLLVAFWVSSYFVDINVVLWGRGAESANGRVMFCWNQPPDSPQWQFYNSSPGESLIGFEFLYTFGHPNQGSVMCLPYWLLVIIAGLITAATWARGLRIWFSVRSLLIVVTLVAVVLGVWRAITTPRNVEPAGPGSTDPGDPFA